MKRLKIIPVTLHILTQNGEWVIISLKHAWFHSIRWKLLLTYLLITYVPLIFFFNTIMHSIQEYFEGDREKKLQSSANIIAANITKSNYFANLSDETRRQLLDADLDNRSMQGGFRILILDNRLIVLNDTNYSEIGVTAFVDEVQVALVNKNAVGVHSDERSIYAAASIENEFSETVGAVLLIISMEDIFNSVSDIQQKLFVYTLLTSIIMGVLVIVASQLIIDPLRNILGVVKKMSDGRLDQRIYTIGHDEYATLGQAFNEMADKLEKVNTNRAEFVSNVSHELKTPLSSMKILSESILLQEGVPEDMYREFLFDINSEVDRLARVVTDLLQLVKLDQGELGLTIRPVSLNAMVADILKRLTPLAGVKNISLIVDEV
ncbi:MAG: cell wall metabolism sensor histidine kinase WalK, partial [Clostridiales bacterium]|nr:cell wall metabolism sensor histidine kinase WalK [Clostridiales bacterium]